MSSTITLFPPYMKLENLNSKFHANNVPEF